MSSTATLRHFAPHLLLSLILLIAVVVGAFTLIQGQSTSATSASLPALRWANEGISDLYTLDPAKGPDFNARQAVQLIYGGLVRFGPGFRLHLSNALLLGAGKLAVRETLAIARDAPAHIGVA